MALVLRGTFLDYFMAVKNKTGKFFTKLLLLHQRFSINDFSQHFV